MLDKENKGKIYEGLLEKNAEDTKSEAGQYFTPRTLIWAMVKCIRPEPTKASAAPACGTVGFFLAAYDFLVKNYFRIENRPASSRTTPSRVTRLCKVAVALMNMFLHNISDVAGKSMISSQDDLIASSPEKFDIVVDYLQRTTQM